MSGAHKGDDMRNYSMVSISFMIGVLSGCAPMVTYRVLSTPSNAQVDVNGVSMGRTPTEINLECNKHRVPYVGWVYGAPFTVTVYPAAAIGGKYSQTKLINPCDWKGKNTPTLEFDLGLQNMAPAQPININTESQPSATPPPSTASNQQEILENLKKLHAQGVLSDAEYKEKVVKVLDSTAQ
jgi:hypothetical protein